MKENEIENLKNMEQNKNNRMDEKVHYEIKFVETENGYRLEASGDKEMLKRLGIGPRMVGKVGKGGHGRRRGRRAAMARHGRRMGHWRRRQAAMAQRRQHGMQHPGQFAEFTGPGCPEFAQRPRRRFHGPWRGQNAGPGFGPSPEKGMPDSSEETWDW